MPNLGYGYDRPHSAFVASRAPSTSAPSLAHTMLGWISVEPAKDAKPQSAPAMTRSRPTMEAERAVERLHAHGRPPSALVHRRVAAEDVVGDQARVVDLQQEAGGHDRRVLLAHGLGNGEEVVLVGLVVEVGLPPLDVGRRDGRD